MRKSIAVILIICMTVSACSSGESASAPAQTQAAYQMQAGDTQVTGEVTSVVGNEITLALVTLEESGTEDAEKTPENKKPDIDEAPEKGFPEGFDPSDPKMGREKPANAGERPDRKNREGAPSIDKADFPKEGKPEGFSGKKSSKAGKNKTGETATYILPAGMTIAGLSGRSTDFSGVSEGLILTLTLNSDGAVVAAECV